MWRGVAYATLRSGHAQTQNLFVKLCMSACSKMNFHYGKSHWALGLIGHFGNIYIYIYGTVSAKMSPFYNIIRL